MNGKEYAAGMRAGIPVCVGYFSVSFGFGAMTIARGLSGLQAVLISALNLTSAGQFAGVTVIAADAGLIEMVLTQLVINSRYILMSLALGQRLGSDAGTGRRLAAAFFNTDEVFALGMNREGKLTAEFFAGVGTVAALGWISGTAIGAAAGSILPVSLRSALGIMLYGMFAAIVIPQARREKSLGNCMILSLVLSCLFSWLPGLKEISAGLAIVICTVAAAALCALFFPVQDEETEI